MFTFHISSPFWYRTVGWINLFEMGRTRWWPFENLKSHLLRFTLSHNFKQHRRNSRIIETSPTTHSPGPIFVFSSLRGSWTALNCGDFGLKVIICGFRADFYFYLNCCDWGGGSACKNLIRKNHEILWNNNPDPFSGWENRAFKKFFSGFDLGRSWWSIFKIISIDIFMVEKKVVCFRN
jgi:hypothetical protein